MKKIKFLAIPVLAALVFAGCGDAAQEVNKAPSVTGVKDIKCMVNSTVDFLDGVAALDKEDGDITPDMQITVTPHVDVSEDGYAHFTEVGEYTVSYSVADSKGRVATKRAYVDVVDRETYKTFALADGFTANAFGEASIEKSGMINGEFVLETKGGEIAEDVKLSRTFTLTTNLQYTFRYTINSNVAGKIKVMADGYDCAEILVEEGNHVYSFTHTARMEKDEKERDVVIDVCLGSLGDAKWNINRVEYEFPQIAGTVVEQVDNFNFNEDNVKARIEEEAKGKAYADTEKNAACLEITQTYPGHIWLGGMFIDTGITVNSGVTYTVSFKVEAEQNNKFEIIFQNSQWNEVQIDKLDTPLGEVSHDISINADNNGKLWIYVQSGDAKNKITISDISVVGRLNPTATIKFPIADFTEFHADGYDGTLTTESGSFTYKIANFSAKDNAQQVTSPSFLVSGSSANYVVSFKAKASAPVEMIVAAANYYSGWNPTIMWSRITLGEEAVTYSFFCHEEKDAADTLYKIIWQFGSPSNQKFSDVTIEISDVKISIKINGLDG